MDGNLDNKLADSKKREQERRIEIGMMNHLIEKYPREAREKTRKLLTNKSLAPSPVNVFSNKE